MDRKNCVHIVKIYPGNAVSGIKIPVNAAHKLELHYPCIEMRDGNTFLVNEIDRV